MAGGGAPTATDPSGARGCRPGRRARNRQQCAPAALDRLTRPRSVTRLEARQRPRPDAENFDGEVSSCSFPEMLNASRIYSPLMFAALMIGHHFSISAL